MYYILTILVWLLFDQLTKHYIQANFVLHQPHVIIPNFLSITYATNTGGAFSMFSQHPGFFLIMSSTLTVIGILLTWTIIKLPISYQIALGSLIGGAGGNLIDRLRIGKVVDFIAFSFWPTFNVADIGIFVGVALLMILLFREKAVETKETPATAPDASLSETDEIPDEDGAATDFSDEKQESNPPDDEKREEKKPGI